MHYEVVAFKDLAVLSNTNDADPTIIPGMLFSDSIVNSFSQLRNRSLANTLLLSSPSKIMSVLDA